MFKAAFWSSFDRILYQIFNLIIAITIARYLGPEQLGVIAIITGYVYFLNIFVDGGLTISIIRNKNITEPEISSIFYFNFSVSLFFIFLTLSFSAFIEDYFQIKDLAYFLNISSLNLLFNSVAFVRYAKLEQGMQFKLLSIVNLSSIVISGTICFVMLYKGYGIFAVVLFGIISSFIKNFFYLTLTPKVEFHRFEFKILKPHLIFGKNLLLSSCVEAIYNNGFPVLITKLFTSYHAGIFFQSKRLLDGPTNLLSGASRRLFLPSAAKFGNNLQKTEKLLEQVLTVVNFLLVLLLGLLFINADFIILKLMGSAWEDSVLILRILLFGMIFYPSFFLCVDVFKAQGASKLYSRIIIFSRIVSILLILTSSIFGFVYIVIFISLAQLVMYVIVVGQLKSKYSFSPRKIFKTIYPFLLIMIPSIILLDFINVKVEYNLILFFKSIAFTAIYFVLNIYLNGYNPLQKIILKFRS